MGKNKNFKSKVKLMTILITIIILILAVILISLKIREKNNVFSNSENISDAREVGYQKLDEKDFKIDTEKNEITFGENTKVGTFCISESPDGPTEDDKWIVTSGEKTVKLEESSNGDNEIKKKYVYYIAGTVSTITDNYNSAADIFMIRNEAELKEFASKVNSGTTFEGKTIYLVSDIALSSNHTPIGTSAKPFKGIFDGNGYTISNITIDKTKMEYVGLFGEVVNGTIKNITVKGTAIKGKNLVGGIAGRITNGTIENCINTIPITASGSKVGGIVGVFRGGTIRNCKNSAKIKGGTNGGIVGYVNAANSYIHNCINTGAASNGIAATVSANSTNSYIEYTINKAARR